MAEICRLCCSAKFVNNDIFDEENALYLKMSLYLPIKVFKNDKLPQKVCDKCSCKVNDFYQFCNETIEVQNRLRSLILATHLVPESVDLTLVKQDISTPALSTHNDQSTQTEDITSHIESNPNQTPIIVKEEPKPLSPPPVKTEEVMDNDSCDMTNDIDSDNSEDLTLVKLKKSRKMTNGSTETKRGRKRKDKLKDWDILLSSLPQGSTLDVVGKEESNLDLKQEVDDKEHDFPIRVDVKREMSGDTYQCCICFTECYGRAEMLKHYKQHGGETDRDSGSPAAPPLPDLTPLRCPRCSKCLERSQWARHWQRHYERDTRPYRCALCEKTFRDHHQILKHGLTHKASAEADSKEGKEGKEGKEADKRFVCDLCPEEFVYMRYLLAHRTRAHPEAAGVALALRCARCGRAFAHLNSLRRHLRAHSGERNHLCNVCGKALSSREHLKFHIRIHTGYKPNVCRVCGKGFVKKCNLTLHERVHSGEKPHVCSHCGKAFSQRSTLVIHERYHSGARPYVCALCGRGFVAKGLLSMHLKTTCI